MRQHELLGVRWIIYLDACGAFEDEWDAEKVKNTSRLHFFLLTFGLLMHPSHFWVFVQKPEDSKAPQLI